MRREYKQVSLTTEAYHSLQKMTIVMSASLAQRITLSQAIMIAERMCGEGGTVENDARGIVE